MENRDPVLLHDTFYLRPGDSSLKEERPNLQWHFIKPEYKQEKNKSQVVNGLEIQDSHGLIGH